MHRIAALRDHSANSSRPSARRTIRTGLHRIGADGGRPLARPSASDREHHIHHPARGVPRGPVLSPHALLLDPSFFRGEPAGLVCLRGRRFRIRHGDEGSHGDRAPRRALVQSHLRVPIARRNPPPKRPILHRPRIDLATPSRDQPGRPAVRLGRVPNRKLDAADLRRDAIRRDSALSSPFDLAVPAMPRLCLAVGIDAVANHRTRHRHCGVIGGNGMGFVPQPAAGISRRLLFSLPFSDVQHHPHQRSRV